MSYSEETVINTINEEIGKKVVDKNNFDKLINGHLQLLTLLGELKTSGKMFSWDSLKNMGAQEFLVLLTSHNIGFAHAANLDTPNCFKNL